MPIWGSFAENGDNASIATEGIVGEMRSTIYPACVFDSTHPFSPTTSMTIFPLESIEIVQSTWLGRYL
jgi:hypothetical protein